MSKLLDNKQPLWFKQVNQKLNEKGFELKKRRVYVIKPMGKGGRKSQNYEHIL